MNEFAFFWDVTECLEKHGLAGASFSVRHYPANRILNKPARTEIVVEVPT